MSFNSSDRCSLYGLVDEHASGILVSWIKYARATGDYAILEEYCDTAVRSYLYNGGKGKLIAISELVKSRNKQRNANIGALRRKKGRGKSGPNILDDINQEKLEQSDFLKALKVLDGVGSRHSFRYRELVWDISQRGSMGENLLHICLLHNTAEQNDLAKFVVGKFPRLVNDIFLSEDYYGLSPLHQAIVNEDVEMMYFLLRQNADVHQRQAITIIVTCYGAFFCAEDQKGSRTDSLEHEWVDLNPNTRYTGQMYWGEYPLSFAACTNQQEAYRLLRAFKADPNKQDTNGNTVLHLTVIHDLPEMFKLAFQLGVNLHVRNNAKLTPLALAAKLANKKMYDLILRLEMDVLWRYGEVVCEVFSLEDIDTIRQDTGDLNPCSVLANIVYGDKYTHLDFLDGLIEDILEKKWEVFARRRMFISLFGYLWFVLVLYTSFMTRDLETHLPPHHHSIFNDTFDNETLLEVGNATLLDSVLFLDQLFVDVDPPWSAEDLPPQCLLWDFRKRKDKIRVLAELLTVIAVIVRTTKDVVDVQRSGYKRWMKTIVRFAFPEKVLHKFAQFMIFIMVILRCFCFLSPVMLVMENGVAIAVILMTSLHFLFYCRQIHLTISQGKLISIPKFRGVRFVGPFVLMVYKIIVGDMLRFFLIYSVFITAFAQAFFLIFQSCERAERDYLAAHPGSERMFENIVSTPFEAVMRMFIMSVGEFGKLYQCLNDCRSRMAGLGKVFFTVYELIVTVMLLNLLIAMMTRTYEKIAEAQKEWKRQWAQVILMLEQSLSARERLLALVSYSRPLKSDKRQRAFIVKEKRKVTAEEQRYLDVHRKRPSIARSNSPQIRINNRPFHPSF